jgi:hypothetical protein
MQDEIDSKILAAVIGLIVLILLVIGWRVVVSNSGPNLDKSAVTQPTNG